MTKHKVAVVQIQRFSDWLLAFGFPRGKTGM